MGDEWAAPSIDAFEIYDQTWQSKCKSSRSSADLVPSEAAGFEGEEFEKKLATTLAFLSTIKTPEQYKLPQLRDFRRVMTECCKLRERTMFDGMTEEQYRDHMFEKRSDKKRESRSKQQQKKYINSTALRQGRIDKLNALKNSAKEEEVNKMLLMVPDGSVESSANYLRDTPENDSNDSVELNVKPRSCYVCKKRYFKLHHFYDQLCESCAPLNWEKRFQTCNLTGRVAVVTGSRVKIGYQTCLKLLRAGCTVIATSRFPNAACLNYTEEDDFDEFKGRLHVYGLDLRDVAGVEAFTAFVKLNYSRVDILINNACQTIRRPCGYYKDVVETEKTIYETLKQNNKHDMLTSGQKYEEVRAKMYSANNSDSNLKLISDSSSDELANVSDGCSINSFTEGISHSAKMSQMVLLPEDSGVDESVLPKNVRDVNGQQLDLRTHNSWLLKMGEVSTPEVVEAMFINVISPFVLNSSLKPLMCSPDSESRPNRYIINVSAMEGKFYRYKTPNHPHTNMAKAALNMMTRTSAEDLAKKNRIFMNSVDTGWINDENPLERASKTAENNNFQTPIDEIDAAARILDPVFTGVNGEKSGGGGGGGGGEFVYEFGKFFKDYHETEW